jgi:hypothetical protein
MNQLRITKVDGMTHIVPLSGLKGQHRMNSLLPASKRSRIEEVNEKGDIITVITEGAAKPSTALATENALLKAEIERLKNEKANASSATQDDAKTVIASINAASSEDDVNMIIDGDSRPAVLKAAQAKIKALKK